MPIISQIGRRSWRVRAVYTSIFVLLILGSVTMIYPFLLMFSGSFKSETDSEGLSVYPAFWFDDAVLYQKYLEARYETMDRLEAAHHMTYGSWRKTAPVETLGIEPLDERWVAAYREYRDQADWSASWFDISQSQATRYVRLNARRYRAMLRDRFDDLQALNDHYGAGFVSWESVDVPAWPLASRRTRSSVDWGPYNIRTALIEFKRTLVPVERAPVNVDGNFWFSYLRPLYPKLEGYNETHATDVRQYRTVVLTRRAPTEAKAREDWEAFVRHELNLSFIRLDPSLEPAFRAMLARQYEGIAEYNRVHGTTHDGFEKVAFPARVPDTVRTQEDMSVFLGDAEACPLDLVEVYGPRLEFLEYVEEHRTDLPESLRALPLPVAEADHADFLVDTSAVRWEETCRNYIHVINYVLLHGRAAINTVIYCSLMIAATLLVNPLAAYALSRYRPPSQYKILLICMATMAFPGEVTMIPAFLLLKKFPLWNLITGFTVCATLLYVGFKMFPKGSEAIIGLSAMVAGILSGWWAAPLVAALFGYDSTHTSLLNTFAALVLPSMANGYGLFLLKGFFDSLPRELYESADIDGAGEWTKFWSFTMALSKPILAVLALGAFTGAYSEFMMALIIIPARDMWTLMVWIFQLQIGAGQPVIHASVLIAAIPTFIVFIFCQNIIIRGIVVPVEK